MVESLERLSIRQGGYMELKATIETWKKGKWYLARIPELDFLSQGRDLEEAKVNLMAASRVKSRLDPFLFLRTPLFLDSVSKFIKQINPSS